MPRYLLERRPSVEIDAAAVTRVTAQRFPEVAVEHRYELVGDGDRREVWVCRAPSEAHVRAWLGAVGVTVDAVSPIAGDTAGRD